MDIPHQLKSIYLASASPRRKELLSMLGVDICVCPMDIEECSDKTLPKDIAMDLACQKLGDMWKKYPDRLIIAADTVVYIGGKILGKPRDTIEARAMLQLLSNRRHTVGTGYAIAYQGNVIVGYDMSQVTVKELSDKVIDDYIATNSPMDKAGAYGIQDGVIVESCCGDINTVIGLPLDKIISEIERIFNRGVL